MATERGGEEGPTHRTPQQQPSQVGKMSGKKLRKVRKAAVLSLFWNFVCKIQIRNREGDQAGFYKHLKTMNLEEKRDRSSAYVKNENRVLLRNVELIRERWIRWFHTLLFVLATKAIVTRVREKLNYQNNATVTAGPPDANEAGRVNLVAGGDGALRPD